MIASRPAPPPATPAQVAIVALADVLAEIVAADLSPRDLAYILDCLRRRVRNAQDRAALAAEWELAA